MRPGGIRQKGITSMSELRDLVIDAHGGIERWNKVKAIDADMSITGAMWARKGWPDALKAVHVTADTRTQWISYRPFISEGVCSVCTPDRTLIETQDGKPIKDRKNPRAAFDGHTVETRWDDLNLAYFSGYAMWNYLNTPFIFALPGFKTEEIEPWHEDGEKHRRLRVVFPDHIATHCSEQIFHVNGEGLICRMDYSAPVTGGAPTAHYVSEHKEFSGVKIATKRRALRRTADGTAIPDPVFVAIDIADIRLA
jgi:hypothetical protein